MADNGPANDVAPPGTYPAIGFPADADAIAEHIHGVVAAGVWWPVALPEGTSFSASRALSGVASQTVNLLAASPGAVKAMVPAMVAGSPLTTYENDTAQHVAMIDSSTAATLGISPARTDRQRAEAASGTEPHWPARPADGCAEQGADRDGRADANCTLSSDLAGVYFAVQANYEQQFVSANRQALDAGVREYKAAFAKELKALPALLQTTSATPNLVGGPLPGHNGGQHSTAEPSPSQS